MARQRDAVNRNARILGALSNRDRGRSGFFVKQCSAVLRVISDFDARDYDGDSKSKKHSVRNRIMKVGLSKLAYARSGDKGDGSNVGVVAYNADCYEIIKSELTPQRVKAHFKEICFGDVDRYEAPNLLALNFILHDSLGGGGSESLKTDAQGKTHGLGMLYMEIDVPDDFQIPTRPNSV